VPAALINVRTPSSLNKSRFLATSSGVDFGAALASPLAMAPPASGEIEIYFMISLFNPKRSMARKFSLLMAVIFFQQKMN
jgi:hypothetical protein